jgi:hypothetical protein
MMRPKELAKERSEVRTQVPDASEPWTECSHRVEFFGQHKKLRYCNCDIMKDKNFAI